MVLRVPVVAVALRRGEAVRREARVQRGQPGILVALARRLAQSSPFFLSFVLLRTAQSVPLELIHPPFHLGFVSKWLAHKLRGTTGLSETQLRSWTLPEATPLHRVPAQTMLIFFLGQTYAIIAPVLLPACALFFAMFTVVWRHNVVYHYRQRYVAGGNLWPWIVRHVVFSVIFAQVVAIFGTGGWTGTSQRLALVPLPFLTTWVYFAELTPHLEQASVRPLDSTLDKEHADNMFRLEEEVVREAAKEAERAAMAKVEAMMEELKAN